MKSLLLLFLISNTIYCTGQEILPPPDSFLIEVDSIIIEEYIIDEPDLEAQFPGGSQELLKYIHNEFDWDCVHTTDTIIERSKVYLSFLVEEDGSIANISIDRGINQFIDQCFIDFIKKKPKWNPATNRNGKPVTQRVRLPIVICFY